MTNPYTMLGISEGSSQDEIETAYRLVTKKTHPIIFYFNAAQRKHFHLATEAYVTLSDFEKRQSDDVSKDIEIAINELYLRMEPDKEAVKKELARASGFTFAGLMIGIITALSGHGFYASFALIFGLGFAFRGYCEYDGINKYIAVKVDEILAKFGSRRTIKDSLANSYFKYHYEIGNSDDSEANSNSKEAYLLYYNDQDTDELEIIENKKAIRYLMIIFAVTMGIFLLIYFGTSIFA